MRTAQTEMCGQKLEEKITDVELECRSLIFDHIDSSVAWELGKCFQEISVRDRLEIAVSISLDRKRLFYYATDLTAPINEHWVIRKENVVYTFYKSSYQMSLYMQLKEDNLKNRYGLRHDEYAAMGGSVPIIVNGAGTLGAVTVSGLTEEEDHKLAVKIIKEYLDKNCANSISNEKMKG